jgi:hypothetical protein
VCSARSARREPSDDRPLLRLTHGATGGAVAIGLSVALWIVVPSALAMRRLSRIDIV